MSRLYSSLIKRVLDFCFAIPAVIFFFPLIVLSLLIPGVRLLKKPRLGRGVKPFSELRLRCPESGFGHRLETISFHRLPALWNILIGQMSFIGPQALRNTDALPAEGADHPRFRARPGYISPWWVRVRSNMTFDDPFEVDADYVTHMSLKGDLGILLRAVLASLYGSGTPAEASETLSLFDVRIDNITTADAIARIDHAIREKEHLRISFVNADSLNKAYIDSAFHDVLNGSDLVLGDGIGVKLGTKMTNQVIVENVNGTDLFPRLCEHMSQEKQSLYLLGAEEGIAQRVSDWIAENHPGVRVAGLRNGFFQASENDAVCAQICESQADVLLVAQGAPRQETWIRDNMAALGVSVAIGVGGLFDFYSGKNARAPMWMREAGIEWVYRLVLEPRRMFKRYIFGNILFIARIRKSRKKS
jgi:N-acetylglucosaminyldiphosphoundecaprenol N-acetyl-beta-D-mannosaminyltransferase